MKVEPSRLRSNKLHDFYSRIITPRPIAFVSTIDEKGRYNAAPFSSFAHLGLVPSVVTLAIGRRKGQKKDTVRNIESTGDFVVNMVDEHLAEAMNQASADYPPDVDEIKETGLTALRSEKVRSPRIAEAPISLECKLMQILELGTSPNRSSIVFGEILLVHIKDEIMTKGEIDPLKAKIIGRLGDTNTYCRTVDIFEMKRPQTPQ